MSEKKRLFSFLSTYKYAISLVILLSLILNIFTLVLPRISARIIDVTEFGQRELNSDQIQLIIIYAATITIIFILALTQRIVASKVSEDVASALRDQLMEKISMQSFNYINKVTVQKLLTNLTSDVDAIKQFVAQGSIIVFSSFILIFGSSILLLEINWQLALPVILSIPIIFGLFGFIFSKINKYFVLSQEIVDSLNNVINETIVGAGLIRVLNANADEKSKFKEVNKRSYSVGVKIIRNFALLIPTINFISNVAVLIVVGYGGSQVIDGNLSAGDYAAFFTYIGTFIAPIIFLGFLASIFTRAFASFGRIVEVLDTENTDIRGNIKKEIVGNIQLKNVDLAFGNKSILKDISFEINPHKKTAIIGPTAAGKSQIFYLISGLLKPDNGEVLIDNNIVTNYDPESFYSQVGLVFQDSILFNTSLRENIAFSDTSSDDTLEKALDTAEMWDYAKSLDKGLDTIISERGGSLSGGQKQRLTLARTLAVNPKILMLDDFTARVDVKTERSIFNNLDKNYPDLTIISITQKIAPVKDFDKIILIMEGDLIAEGTHQELLEKSFEYRQIYESQQSTEEEDKN